MNAAPHLRVVEPTGGGYLEVATALQRRFVGMPDDEPAELTFFFEGRVFIAHATTAEHHVRLLHEAERRRDFNGAYQLVNGPMDPALLARYEPNQIVRAWNGRATDRDVGSLRAVFIDIDVKRPKGISSTDAQLEESRAVADTVERFLSSELGDDRAIGRGCSGNGFFLLVAIDPRPFARDDMSRVSGFLKALNNAFGTDTVKIDSSVATAARLMPAAGTWKRKGRDTPERPHRRTSFCCRANVRRVSLDQLA